MENDQTSFSSVYFAEDEKESNRFVPTKIGDSKRIGLLFSPDEITMILKSLQFCSQERCKSLLREDVQKMAAKMQRELIKGYENVPKFHNVSDYIFDRSYDTVLFSSKIEAENVLNAMKQTINENGYVTIHDYYLFAMRSIHESVDDGDNKKADIRKYGWLEQDLEKAEITELDGGWFFIDFNEPHLIMYGTVSSCILV